MSFGPAGTATELTATTADADTLVPASKAGARDEIKLSALLDALLRVAAAGGVVMLDGTAGKLVVRQRGGVAGTDEVQLSHDGSNVLAENLNATGGFYFYVGGSQIFRGVTDGATPQFFVPTNAQFGLGDAFLTRLAAGVLATNEDGSTPGWLQNTAGRAVLGTSPTNNTTTFSDLTGLSRTLKAGRKYSGRLVLKCSDSTAAEGIKFDFNGGTATMTSFDAGVVGNVQGATAGTTVSAALATAINFTGMNGTTAHFIEIAFSMTVNAGGTFIPRFAQNSHSSGTATVSLGSYVMIEDMP